MDIDSSEKVRYEDALNFNAPTIIVTALDSNKINISVMREARRGFKVEKQKTQRGSTIT